MLTEREVESALRRRIRVSARLEDAATACPVMEAVPENLALKLKIFAERVPSAA